MKKRTQTASRINGRKLDVFKASVAPKKIDVTILDK